MKTFDRLYAAPLARALAQPYVHIMFGARQTGKSTLIRNAIPDNALVFDLSDPQQRTLFAASPARLIEVYRSLPASNAPHWIFIDEVQTVPELFNAVQFLYDEEKRLLPDTKRTRFILCGSSARRLRQTGTNLLPGRSIMHRLYPLTSLEYEPSAPVGYPSAAILEKRSALPPLQSDIHFASPFPRRGLDDRLIFGDLPSIATETIPPETRRDILRTYTSAYMEEELHRETQIRNWSPFLRFLNLAAAESGSIVNFAALAKETGLTAPTIKSHYQLLEDMFLGFTVPAFSGSTRKTALSSPRFFFFDLGLRNAATGLAFTADTLTANPGPLFEQWVGIELHKRLSYQKDGTLSYYRTSGGTEIDFIVEKSGTLYPIEVKWTENPSLKDARHLESFISDHRAIAPHGYIVCRCPYPARISDTITAIPWWAL